jgi:hypothetical protein
MFFLIYKYFSPSQVRLKMTLLLPGYRFMLEAYKAALPGHTGSALIWMGLDSIAA